MNAHSSGIGSRTRVERLVRADKLELLYRQSYPALFVSLLAAGLLGWVLWQPSDAGALLAWIALLLASTAARMAMFAAYFRTRPTGEALLRWERPYAASLLLSAAIWGFGALAIMSGRGPIDQVYTQFVLIGMAGGAVSTYSAHRYMAISAMAAVLAPATVWLAFQPGRLQIAMALGSLVFMAASVRATKVLSSALHRSYQLTHELEEAQRHVEDRDQHFRFIAEKSGDAIWILDPTGERVAYVSPAVRQLLGHAPDALAEKSMADLMTAESLRRFRERLAGARPQDGGGGTFRTELDLAHRDGHVVHTEVVATLQFDAQGALDSVIAVTHDISERKRDADSIRRLAFFDTLTELPNRRLLVDRLQQAIARAHRDHSRVGVLCIDLDRFKPVNDQYGHQTGDWLLRAIASRVRDAIRQSDTAARVGGDEFIVLLSDLALPDDAAVAAEKIRTAVERPFVTAEGHTLSVSSSIGIALFPDHAGNAWDLLRVGDAAMYRGKRGGGNAVAFAEADAEPAGDVARMDDRGLVRLEWKPFYGSGDPQIDAEHRALFVMANRLIERAAAREQDFPGFLATFDALLAEVATHFEHEEATLRHAAYAGADAHALLHRRLLEQAGQLRRRAEARDVTVDELADFLVLEVVGRHFLRADRAYIQELRLGADAQAEDGSGARGVDVPV